VSGRLHSLLERLRSGRRPPTGPLTTAEQATANDLEIRTETERAEQKDDPEDE